MNKQELCQEIACARLLISFGKSESLVHENITIMKDFSSTPEICMVRKQINEAFLIFTKSNRRNLDYNYRRVMNLITCLEVFIKGASKETMDNARFVQYDQDYEFDVLRRLAKNTYINKR